MAKYSFANLLLQISNNLGDTDFEQLAFLCYNDPLSTQEIEECGKAPNKVLKLFQKMKKRDKISVNKVGWLKEVLRLLEKTSMIKQVESYEEEFIHHIHPIRSFLHALSKNINEKDLEHLKTLVGLNETDMDGTTLNLFSKMENKGIISYDEAAKIDENDQFHFDLTFLKKVLKSSKLEYLVKQIEEFEKKYSKGLAKQQPTDNSHSQIKKFEKGKSTLLAKQVGHEVESRSKMAAQLNCGPSYHGPPNVPTANRTAEYIPARALSAEQQPSPHTGSTNPSLPVQVCDERTDQTSNVQENKIGSPKHSPDPGTRYSQNGLSNNDNSQSTSAPIPVSQTDVSSPTQNVKSNIKREIINNEDVSDHPGQTGALRGINSPVTPAFSDLLSRSSNDSNSYTSTCPGTAESSMVKLGDVKPTAKVLPNKPQDNTNDEEMKPKLLDGVRPRTSEDLDSVLVYKLDARNQTQTDGGSISVSSTSHGGKLSAEEQLQLSYKRHAENYQKRLEAESSSQNLQKIVVNETKASASNPLVPDVEQSHSVIKLDLHGPESEFSMLKGNSKIHTDSPMSDLSVEVATSQRDVRPKSTLKIGAYSTLSRGDKLPEGRTQMRLQVEEAQHKQLLERTAFTAAELAELQALKRKRNIKEKVTGETKLYGYQFELAEPALDGTNCILCAPTGSGKTYTAGYICYQRMEETRCKVLFVVCIRNLVSQQTIALKEIFPENKRLKIGAIGDTQTLEEMLDKFDVIVLTAQVLVNSLKEKQVFLQDFGLMVLDECHHTDLGHPYNVLMYHYHELKKAGQQLPQIVGLTASLGVGNRMNEAIEHYIRICANLDCTKITHVCDEDNKAALLRINPKPLKNQIAAVPRRDSDDMFMLNLIDIMKQIEDTLDFHPPGKQEWGTQQYENWIVEQQTIAETKGLNDDIFLCESLRVLNTALMYYDDLQAIDILPLLEKHFREENRPEELTDTRQIVYELYDDNIVDLREFAAEEILDNNPKLERLAQLLTDLFTSEPESLSSKGLLLTRTRFTVDGLVAFIQRQKNLKDIIKCGKFVGQGRGDGAMTDNEQDLILTLFMIDSDDSKKFLNLLVATDVAQEGLDMPLCNFVIRYNFVSNEIGSVQSRGRARAINSQCYLIVNKDSINEQRELLNLEKEYAMMEALDDIDAMNPDELQERIRQKQEELWIEHQNKEMRKERRQTEFSTNTVTIYCRGCKQFLARGEDLRKKGSNYIVIDREYPHKIKRRNRANQRPMRYDTQIADTFCGVTTCNRAIGPLVRYNSGHRLEGYILSKDAVMWKYNDQEDYRPIKQWSKVPFQVAEELVTE